MQTILGAGGAIGTVLASELKSYTDKIRLVSRNPQKINKNDELMLADLTNSEALDKAVNGSDVTYLMVGLPYNLKVWQTTWPVIMSNVIDACKKHNSKLVFFDNIYMYDPIYLNHMTEDTPINPPSNKGKVRAQIAQMLLDTVEKGELDALIARSADFYGPSINTSVLIETVFKNFSKGKKANWLGPVTYKHSYTFTPDAAKATAMLGNTSDAFNQVWHVPTAPEPPTGKEWIEYIATEMGVEPKYQTISKTMLRLIGVFVPVMREMVEMMYQNDRDYVFDSTKFVKHFNFQATPYLDGIKKIVKQDYTQK